MLGVCSMRRGCCLRASAHAFFRSAFTIRGFAAGHDRRHDEQVQKPITVAPVITCSSFTKALSWHPGHTGIVEADNRVEDARVVRARSINILVVRN
jgi:hypothetical protein